jgi:activator-of-BECN1-regulated-autophagy protein 1
MGTHFSPCGRFLVACVACLLPQTEVGEHVSQSPVQYDSTGAGTSPTRHPLPSRRVIYELRVYSLEEETYVFSMLFFLLFDFYLPVSVN